MKNWAYGTLEVTGPPPPRKAGRGFVAVTVALVVLGVVSIVLRSQTTEDREHVDLMERGIDDGTATVYLIRHCEEEGSRRHCNSRGFRRAEFLSTAFDGSGSFRKPEELFARAPEPRKYVMREIETLEPMAENLGLQINS